MPVGDYSVHVFAHVIMHAVVTKHAMCLIILIPNVPEYFVHVHPVFIP